MRKGSFAPSRWVCRQRNLLERFYKCLKQMWGLTTRYTDGPANLLAARSRPHSDSMRDGGALPNRPALGRPVSVLPRGVAGRRSLNLGDGIHPNAPA